MATAPTWRDLPLRCPQPGCHAPLNRLYGETVLACTGCGRRFGVADGIPRLLIDSAADTTITANNAVYDDLGADYDTTLPGHVVRHYLRKRLRFLARLQPLDDIADTDTGRMVLDVGCGTGVLANALARSGGGRQTVAGVDVAVGVLAVMRDRGGVVPIAASGAALPFADDTFDLVVSVAAFHHISDADKVAATLSEMWRVTRPGGVAVIWDHNPDNPYWPLLLARMPKDAAVERLVSAREITDGLIASGAPPEMIRRHTLGFIPEFMPTLAMPLARKLERLGERLPLVRRLAAHNVITAHKPSVPQPRS